MIALIFAGVVLLVLVIFYLIYRSETIEQGGKEWVDKNEFDRRKRVMTLNCSESVFDSFFLFLKTYKGGHIRRSHGQIIERRYTAKELGDLKGIFFNIIVPNPNIDKYRKEEFRLYLKDELGVTGIEERPKYEERDSRLKNRKLGEERARKEVGNKGEEIVRTALKSLDKNDFSVINGPALEFNGEVKEIDHIVVWKTGVFCLETKAFGMTNGQEIKCAIFIDKGDKWILRKAKQNKELESPTEQVLAEKKLLWNILAKKMVEIHSVLVISNSNAFIKNNINLDYDVLNSADLVGFIENYPDELDEDKRKSILNTIDRKRVN